MTHWSSRLLAGELGGSHSTVARVWAEHDLEPWQIETFKFSTDPKLEARVRDVVGLYLDLRHGTTTLFAALEVATGRVTGAIHPRIHLHFTPTDGSWLNLVEVFFAIIQRQALCRRDFASVDELVGAIGRFCEGRNAAGP